MFLIMKNNAGSVSFSGLADNYEEAIDLIRWDKDYSTIGSIEINEYEFVADAENGNISWKIYDFDFNEGTRSNSRNALDDNIKVNSPIGEVNVKCSNDDDSVAISVLISKENKVYPLADLLVTKDISLTHYKAPASNPASTGVYHFGDLAKELRKIRFTERDIFDVYAVVGTTEEYEKWNPYISAVSFDWWTATPGPKDREMICMSSMKNSTRGDLDYKTHCLRPAIIFKTLRTDGIEKGAVIVINEHCARIADIDEETGTITAVSDNFIAKLPYGDAHLWEESLPKLVVDGWLYNLLKKSN